MAEPATEAAFESAAAFEALYRRTAPAVLAYARRRTPQPQEAEDVLVEVFAVAWRRRADLPPEPLPWLYATAANVLAHAARSAAGNRRSAAAARLAGDHTGAPPAVVGSPFVGDSGRLVTVGTTAAAASREDNAPMPHTTRTSRVLGCALAGAALVLTGCTSADGSADAASPSADLSAAAAAEEAAAAAPGPYAVGRRTITVTDPARAGRSLATDIWYPVDPAATGGAAPTQYEFIPGLGYTSETALAEAPAAKGPFPLVVYSHGSGGFSWIATYYTEFLASKGYVVVAPNHAGNTAIDAALGKDAPRETSAYNRPADITATLDTVLAASTNSTDPLAGRIDAERIAVSGHSFGGFTSLASAGGHSNEVGSTPADPRVRAVVLMAPWSELLTDDELRTIDVPTLIVSGTDDTSTPIETNTTRPYALVTGRPVVRVDIERAVHNSFTDACALNEKVAGRSDIPAAVAERLAEGTAVTCGPDVLAAARVQELTNMYTAAFLADELGGSDEYAAVLSCAAPPAEVDCTVKE